MAQKIRVTKLMREVEREQGESLETLIPRLVNQVGVVATADHIGVSKATLGYWMLKMGIRKQWTVPLVETQEEVKVAG